MIDRIDELMRSHGIPERRIRAELADTCGITTQAVGDWYLGKSKSIHPDHLGAIAARWGSTTDWIILGRGEMRPGKGNRELYELVQEIMADDPVALEAILRGYAHGKNAKKE